MYKEYEIKLNAILDKHKEPKRFDFKDIETLRRLSKECYKIQNEGVKLSDTTTIAINKRLELKEKVDKLKEKEDKLMKKYQAQLKKAEKHKKYMLEQINIFEKEAKKLGVLGELSSKIKGFKKDARNTVKF